MAYRLKRDESDAEALKRIGRQELESAIDQLGTRTAKDRDEAIHEARKSIKKLRALLRLVRFELGDTYRKESSVLRDVGRKLSELRDAGAVIEILGKLEERFPDEVAGHKLDSVRRGLVARKQHAEQDANIPKVLERMSASLETAAKRVKTWRVQADGFPAIQAGLEDTFRSGRKAFATAQKRGRPVDYHEWRKRVKDHWYHVRLLENLWSDVIKGYEGSLKNLETFLGDDHNLVLLKDRLLAEPESYGKEKRVELTLRLIDKYRKELRDNAVSLGNRIYQEKPKQLTRRMKKLWEEWQAEPESLEKFEKDQKQADKARQHPIPISRAGQA
jgi:CHAD domain-containing protein